MCVINGHYFSRIPRTSGRGLSQSPTDRARSSCEGDLSTVIDGEAVAKRIYFPPAGARRPNSSKKFNRNVTCAVLVVRKNPSGGFQRAM